MVWDSSTGEPIFRNNMKAFDGISVESEQTIKAGTYTGTTGNGEVYLYVNDCSSSAKTPYDIVPEQEGSRRSRQGRQNKMSLPENTPSMTPEQQVKAAASGKFTFDRLVSKWADFTEARQHLLQQGENCLIPLALEHSRNDYYWVRSKAKMCKKESATTAATGGSALSSSQRPHAQLGHVTRFLLPWVSPSSFTLTY